MGTASPPARGTETRNWVPTAMGLWYVRPMPLRDRSRNWTRTVSPGRPPPKQGVMTMDPWRAIRGARRLSDPDGSATPAPGGADGAAPGAVGAAVRRGGWLTDGMSIRVQNSMPAWPMAHSRSSHRASEILYFWLHVRRTS